MHLKTFGRVLGLAAGPHDVSPDFKAYIKRLAAKAGAKRWRTLGARSAREATALYYSTFRREVSIVLARTMSQLMYTRLHLLSTVHVTITRTGRGTNTTGIARGRMRMTTTTDMDRR